ncbi:MAG TPA: DNA polymerase ligase N-terminal domain-containing protein [Thermodesulfovibrionales bacterium]|nr:DNA polymerase ligase N-terminal domain-containing protein [Thermodesulfovibrionales bacterium]
MPKFVVHEHHATHLHFDFRLEMNGVLKSWAVPKGPSMNPKDKRLAILVDDHAMEYGSYEGIIPEGSYGAGAVVIWDKGDYELLRGTIGEGRMEVFLRGTKLRGAFAMARMSGKEKEWLLMKKRDEFAEDDFAMKTVLTPSLLKKLKTKGPPCEAS